jgi:hypothetical protein
MRAHGVMIFGGLVAALMALGACRSSCIGGNCASDGRGPLSKSEPFRAAACPTLDLIPRSVACGRQRDSRDHLKCMQALDSRGYTC